MKKTTMIGTMALAIVGIIFSVGLVSAYRGDYSVEGPNFSDERHDAMTAAFDDADYDAWYKLMTEDGRHPRVVDVVTESNFATFIAAHDAGKSGDSETATQLRAELGLNNGNGPRDGTGFKGSMGRGNGQGQRMQQNNFVDADNDGNCDNTGSFMGKGRR